MRSSIDNPNDLAMPIIAHPSLQCASPPVTLCSSSLGDRSVCARTVGDVAGLALPLLRLDRNGRNRLFRLLPVLRQSCDLGFQFDLPRPHLLQEFRTGIITQRREFFDAHCVKINLRSFVFGYRQARRTTRTARILSTAELCRRTGSKIPVQS
jgi:hypothetical protein